MGPVAGFLLSAGLQAAAYAALGEGIKIAGRALGWKSDEDVDAEIAAHNREAQREARRRIKGRLENEERAARTAMIDAAQFAADSNIPTVMGSNAMMPDQFSLPGEIGAPLQGGGEQMPMDAEAGPISLPDPIGEALSSVQGSDAMAQKLVNAAVASGRAPTELDYHGVLM